jgi:alpha-beta hydrolase superfamily lysophospholipase
MLPVSGKISAVACVCHGYSDNFSYSKLGEYQRLVLQGNIAIVAIEYEGHGLSDGLLAYIEDFTTVIDDVSSYFSYVLQSNTLFQNKSAFLIGESMGGAIAYDVQNRIPHLIHGVVLICPMCKISDEMLPSPIVVDCLKRLLELLPWIGYLPISPSKQNLDNVTYKVRSKYIEASMSPLNYNHPMRLTTARELLDATQRISETLYDFDTSFLVIHGANDVVTDPLMSQHLYDESKSIDKTIKIYDNMWHALTSGETDTDIDIVFNDIIQWIHQRIPITTATK